MTDANGRRRHPAASLSLPTWAGRGPGPPARWIRLPRAAGLLAGLLLLTACAGPGQAAPAQPPGTPNSDPPRAPLPAPASHVFLIVMENKSRLEATSAAYTAGLASEYQVAADYHAVAHPSLPNYLALAGGSTFGIVDDGYHALPAGGLGRQLSTAGISWKAYMEGMTAGCLRSPYPYALKHNPFAYFGGACPPNVVPLTELEQDLALPAGRAPRFTWISPGLCNDTHDCPVATGDRFLQDLVPKILASASWKEGGVLYLVWDEDDGSSDNQVAVLVIAPGETAHTIPGEFDHYSLLAGIEDRLRVGRLGLAAAAVPLLPI